MGNFFSFMAPVLDIFVISVIQLQIITSELYG